MARRSKKAGRSFGNTRTGAEWVREHVMAGKMGRVALVTPTVGDARDVMVEDESGLLAVCDRYAFRPKYAPSKRRVTFLNGAIATTYSAVAGWKHPKAMKPTEQRDRRRRALEPLEGTLAAA